MKFSLYFALVICCLNLLVSKVAAMPVHLTYNSELILCKFDTPQAHMPSFEESACRVTTLEDVDPQNSELWIQLPFDLADKLLRIPLPHGLYLFGKAASEVFLNGQTLGKNGQPAFDKSEIAGSMDTVFYIPEGLLKREGNVLVMHLSAQHSLIDLGFPIHFIGIDQFGPPTDFIQQGNVFGVALFGAFIVGALYFIILSLGQYAKISSRFFAALCLLAALQLGTEMSRSLIGYPYPIQDIRLVTVTVCAALFGMLILGYSSNKVASNQAVHWVYAGAIITLLAIIFATGFDAKTTAGVFFPLMVSLVQLIFYWNKTRDARLLRWFAVHLCVAATIVVSAARFHEIIYFVIVGILLCYLFVQQANEYKAQQKQLSHDQSQIAKLEFQLAQQAQAITPTKLETSMGGKTELIATSDIAYCKAAGDYVELHMTNLGEKLYSGTLKQMETHLPSTFVRVHRSYLVNLNEVVSLGDSQSHSNMLRLSNEQQVPVSRRLLPAVRESLRSTLQ